MPQIDINFTRLFCTILRGSDIELLVVPTESTKATNNLIMETLEKGFTPNDIICTIPSDIFENGEIHPRKTTYMIFGNEDVVEELSRKGEICYIHSRPEAVVMFWRIRNLKDTKSTFYVFRDIRLVDSQIIKVECYADSQQKED
jgi:hypothetical protein